jgi:hypothetical protein
MPEAGVAAVKPKRPRFSVAVHIYLWGFFALLGLAPLGILVELDDRISVPTGWWAASFGWPTLIAGLFLFAWRRCSSEKMCFTDGLLWITQSMMTGWTTFSFLVVPPALLAGFAGAIAMSGWAEIRRQPELAPESWTRIVAFFYRHRMRQ